MQQIRLGASASASAGKRWPPNATEPDPRNTSTPERFLSATFLWPAHTWRGSLDGQHLTRPPPVGHTSGAMPLGRHEKQRPPVGAPEHAGEAASIEIGCLQDFSALANAHAPLVGNVSVPDGVLCIEAN